MLMLTSIANFTIQTNIVAPDQSSLIWVRHACNKDVKWSSRLYSDNASKNRLICLMRPADVNRNACLILIIHDKKHPNYATQKSKYRKAFLNNKFSLADSRAPPAPKIAQT